MSEQVLQEILHQLHGMNHRFDGIDQQLDRMDQRLDRNGKATIEAIQKEQLRHGRVLEALSIKSLEHDAEIHELKRRK